MAAGLRQQHAQRLCSGCGDFTDGAGREPSPIGGDLAAHHVDLLVNRFRAGPRLSQHAQRRSVHCGRELLDQCERRRVVRLRTRGHSNETAISAALLHHRPVIGTEFGIGDSGELQERMVCGELPEEREPIAAAEIETSQ